MVFLCVSCPLIVGLRPMCLVHKLLLFLFLVFFFFLICASDSFLFTLRHDPIASVYRSLIYAGMERTKKQFKVVCPDLSHLVPHRNSFGTESLVKTAKPSRIVQNRNLDGLLHVKTSYFITLRIHSIGLNCIAKTMTRRVP